MKNSPSLTQVGVALAQFIRRYHVILFTLTVVIGVSVAVFMLNALLTSSNSDINSTSTPLTFDQSTIDKINNFTTASEEPKPFSLPAGRVNPLVE